MCKIRNEIISTRYFISVLLSVIAFSGGTAEANIGPVREISVNYPSRSINVFGWETHWVVFLVFTIITGFALKSLFRVEI